MGRTYSHRSLKDPDLPLKSIIRSLFSEYKTYCFSQSQNAKIDRLETSFQNNGLAEVLGEKTGYLFPSSIAEQLFGIVANELKKTLFTANYSEERAIKTCFRQVLAADHLHQKINSYLLVSNCAHRFVRYLETIGDLTFHCGHVRFEPQSELVYFSRFKQEILEPAAAANGCTIQEKQKILDLLRILIPLLCAELREGNYHVYPVIEQVFEEHYQAGEVIGAVREVGTQEEESESRSAPKEFLRTYKVGLRVPESLLEGQNKLIRKIEMLKFFIKAKRHRLDPDISSDFSGFRIYKNLGDRKSPASKIYKRLFKHYKSYTLEELNGELIVTKQNLHNTLEKKHEALLTAPFTRNGLPRFDDPANPRPHEMSLHTYQSLATRSFKMVCKYLNDLAEKYIHHIPLDKEEFITRSLHKAQQQGKEISRRSLEAYPEMAVANFVERYGNMDQIAFSHISAAMDAHRELQTKFSLVRRLLFPEQGQTADFSEEIPVFLAYYSVPNHLKRYLGKAWRVEPSWVRNLLVGWRRKLDPLLPFKFRIEPLTALFSRLADFCKQYAHTEEEIKVISTLQDNHVLHLFSDIDFSSFFSGKKLSAYKALKTRIPSFPRKLTHLIKSRSFDMPISLLLEAARELQQDVKETMKDLTPGSITYKRCKTFSNKINLLETCFQVPEFRPLFSRFLVGNRFTGAVVKLFRTVPAVQRAGMKRLFTALRGVASLTFAKVRPTASVHLKSVFLPQHCLTRPFTSPRRRKAHLPAALLRPNMSSPEKPIHLEKDF
ncbi:MAG: hypothetical protein ACOC35_02740 [Promethearchaeia archaeon]